MPCISSGQRRLAIRAHATAGAACTGWGRNTQGSPASTDTRTVVIAYPEEFEPDEAVWKPFRDAITAWEETGEGHAPCTACGAVVPVTAWRWDPTFAVGTLAFDFWNWPPLSTDFHTAFTHHLQHRTTTHMGKL
ncbi:hypothetical protein [Streptomyces sp. NPDC014806]|uniref:hypothetical protein n=1 Tax=Streptomyces sp. NPDC014806 TaxID=3364920 RepID=UPI0036F8267D